MIKNKLSSINKVSDHKKLYISKRPGLNIIAINMIHLYILEWDMNFSMIQPLVKTTAANKKLLIVAPAAIGSTLEINWIMPKKKG